MTRPLAALLAAAVLGAFAALALAAAPSVTAPPAGATADAVDVQADRLDVDLAKKSAALAGHVVLKRGDLVLRAARLDARFDDAPKVVWARGQGGVAVDVKGTHAEADEVEIDLAAKSLELRGAVTVTRAGSRLSAERATVDLGEGRFSLFAARGTLAAPTSSAP